MIDFMTCSLDDVIARSVALHPSLLTEAMMRAVATHTEASRTMFDGEACRVGVRMAADAHTCVELLNAGELQTAERIAQLSLGRRIMLFTAACRLQCIPHSVAAGIAAREG